MDIDNIDISCFPLRHEVFERKKELGDRLAQLRSQLRQSRRARIRRITLWAGGLVAAACVAFVFFVLQTVTVTTGANEQLITLPCNSTVRLAANSSVSYRPHLWPLTGRNIELEQGAACFAVEKGKGQFTVDAPMGQVSVLGTEFEVAQTAEAMSVKCFTGRVMVTASDAPTAPVELASGEEATVTRSAGIEKQAIEEPEPEPEPEPEEPTLTYDRQPLSNVASEIEHLFGLKIANKQLCNGLTYSGILYKDDRDLTLEVVFSPCGLEYSIDGDTVTLTRIE